MSRLFNAFEQGSNHTARQRSGLGLGLSISRKIVSAHGGMIFAESPGLSLGATFVVELPSIVSRPSNSLSSGGEGRRSVNHGRSLRVLLVEDHAPSLLVMRRLLEMLGHQVVTAGTLSDAEAAASVGNFDVLVSDVGLPDGSGLELMRRLRAKFEGRAIALTGYGTENDIKAAQDAGFTGYLIKPVKIAQLTAAFGQIKDR